MMMNERVAFIKMHGCGNDYIFLDCFTQPLPQDPGALARQVSDRHRSIGSDGLVLMLPSDVPGAVARMRMFNADGSESSLCGNALRCFAMWLYQSGRTGSQGRSFRIAMADRVMNVNVISSDSAAHCASVRIQAGSPERLNPEANGLAALVREVTFADLEIPGLLRAPLHASMGNPHTVMFVRSPDQVPFEFLGPAIENHPQFPHRTNVEFVEITGPNSCTVRVWERGSGETLACGSGACAVVAAGTAAGFFQQGNEISVRMRGGELLIQIASDFQVSLEGPAQECCRGHVVVSARV